jgi:hypothetical protein
MPVQPPISHKHESLASAMRTLKTMLGRESFRKPVLATLATLLAVVAIAYGSIWMYAARSTLQVELGFNKDHSPPYDDLARYDGITSQLCMADVGGAGSSDLAVPISLRAGFRQAVSLSIVCSFGLPLGVAVSRDLCFG